MTRLLAPLRHLLLVLTWDLRAAETRAVAERTAALRLLAEKAERDAHHVDTRRVRVLWERALWRRLRAQIVADRELARLDHAQGCQWEDDGGARGAA